MADAGFIDSGATVPAGFGSANQLLGVNSGASGHEYKSLLAGAGMSIVHAAGTVTLVSSATESGSLEIFNVKSSPYNAVGNGVADDTAAIQAAIDAAEAAGGGVVYFPSSSTSYLLNSARLTVQSDHIWIHLGNCTLDFGALGGIDVSVGCHGFAILGCGGFPDDDSPHGSYISYTGTSSAIIIGDATEVTKGGTFRNVGLKTTGAGSEGIVLNRTIYWSLDHVGLWTTGTNADALLKLVGTGGYTGHGEVKHSAFGNGSVGILGVGSVNAVTVMNNHFGGVAGGIGIDWQGTDSNGNTFLGNDMENWGTALKYAGDNLTMPSGRFEGNTLDINLTADSSKCFVVTDSDAVTVTNSGTRNTVISGGWVKSGTLRVGRDSTTGDTVYCGGRMGVDIDQQIVFRETVTPFNDMCDIRGNYTDANNGYLTFFTRSGGSLAERVRISAAGLLSVGNIAQVPAAANDAAAAGAGVAVGGVYRTNADPSVLCIRTA